MARLLSPERDRNPAPSGAGLFFLCAIALGVLLLPRIGAAEPPRVSLELGVALQRFDYSEYGPTGQLLDRESGVIPAMAGALEVRGAQWYARCGATASSGDVEYSGRTQSANAAFDGLPVTTTSGARFVGLELQAGLWVDAARRVALYAGAARRRWDRGIEPTTVVAGNGTALAVAALEEEYSWVELQGGARLTLFRTTNSDWSVDARVLHALAPRVVVVWGGERVGLDLGERPGVRIGLAMRYALAPEWFLGLEAHWALWRFGASEVDLQSLIYEPDSETRSAGVEGRIGVIF